MENGCLFDTESGTPQGGTISPVLANIALDGLDSLLYEEFKRQGMLAGRRSTWGRRRFLENPKVNLVRYADDFIITGYSKQFLDEHVKPLVREFLAERGLTLSEEKTAITHIEDGFDFLGFHFRKYDGTLLVTPARKSVSNFLRNVREVIRRHPTVAAHVLIAKLNPKIRGWANYYRHVSCSATFPAVEHAIWKALWRWAVRRHRNKGARWIHDRYFSRVETRDWVFQGVSPDGQRRLILLPSTIRVARHVPVKLDANPYDPEWQRYFAQRDRKRVQRSLIHLPMVRTLWLKQDGLCPSCGLPLGGADGRGLLQADLKDCKVMPYMTYGTNAPEQFCLVHSTCHRER